MKNMKNIKAFETYSYDPKEFYKGKENEPATAENLKKRATALKKAEQCIKDAIDELKSIPRTDWFEEIPDAITKLENFLVSDGGESGFSAYLKKQK